MTVDMVAHIPVLAKNPPIEADLQCGPTMVFPPSFGRIRQGPVCRPGRLTYSSSTSLHQKQPSTPSGSLLLLEHHFFFTFSASLLSESNNFRVNLKLIIKFFIGRNKTNSFQKLQESLIVFDKCYFRPQSLLNSNILIFVS